MIYQYVKKYLKITFGKALSEFNWSKEDNILFFNHMDKRFSREKFLIEISEVKQAFKDFFEPVGNIVFRYKNDTINFRIFSYTVEPKYSKHLNSLVEIIKTHKDSIKYPYKGQDDQIAILGKIRRRINFEIQDTKESINQRELIKYAIRVALKLTPRDIVVQLKRKYIVKIFDKNLLVEVKPEDRKGIKNRFNGYTEEEITDVYNEIFRTTEIDYFLNSVMDVIFKNSLNFSTITYPYYEANALKTIHAQIVKELKTYISLEEDFIIGVAGFLMRQYFKVIHEFIAMKIIESVYDKDKNTIEFLLYFDGKIVLENHKKYQVPSILTKDGEKWNSSSLIGLCNLWMNIKNTKIKDEVKLLEIETQLTDENLSLFEVEYFTKQKKEIEDNIKFGQNSIDLKTPLIKSIIESITLALMARKKLL